MTDAPFSLKLLFLSGRNPLWLFLALLIAGLIAIPVLAILSSLFSINQSLWQQLAETVLGEYILNSLILMVGVGLGVLGLGVSTAWLVTLCQFPGSRPLEWALLLPLSSPAYLLAYTYTNLLDYYGPVQSWLRALFGWQAATEYWFPSIRSLGGALGLFVLVLYPYVYLLARMAFLEQGLACLEASRSLGCGPWRSFWRVALPLARPAIVSGVALALMETLNDFGTVQYFGVNTFTTGIYNTWFGLGERNGAAQLAVVLMIFILALLLLEAWSRQRAQYYQATSTHALLPRYALKGWRCLGAWMLTGIPLLLGFVVPVTYLAHLCWAYAQDVGENNFFQLASHSLLVSSVTAGLAVVFGLVLAYGQRLEKGLLLRTAVRIAALGYAIPGSVIAVGVLIPAGYLDNRLDSWMRATFSLSTGLLFSGTLVILVYAYLVRFLAVGFGALESSLAKIKPSLDDAARSLGQSPLRVLLTIHVPLMMGGILTAVMLVFVDVMKELPATLVIRPFNFDTLAVRVYQYASDERLTEAAAPALAIILVGLVPVIFLSIQIAKSRPQQNAQPN